MAARCRDMYRSLDLARAFILLNTARPFTFHRFHGVVGYHVSLTILIDSDKVCGSIPCEIIFWQSARCRNTGCLRSGTHELYCNSWYSPPFFCTSFSLHLILLGCGLARVMLCTEDPSHTDGHSSGVWPVRQSFLLLTCLCPSSPVLCTVVGQHIQAVVQTLEIHPELCRSESLQLLQGNSKGYISSTSFFLLLL